MLIKLIRSIFLAFGDRFYPPSELGSIDKLEPGRAAHFPGAGLRQEAKSALWAQYLLSPLGRGEEERGAGCQRRSQEQAPHRAMIGSL